MILGESKSYVQIGTVMTDEEYRGQELSRVLMEIVLKEWEDKCDIIYLFANDSVLDFYPKFGFQMCNEYQYSMSIIKECKYGKVRKINMEDDNDIVSVYNMACNTLPFSKVSVKHNQSLIMFYATYFMKDSIYYIEEYDTVVICEFDEEILYLQEVLSTSKVNLDSIINSIVADKTKKVVLGFTPNEVSAYEKSLLKEEDTTLFIRKIKDNPFKSEDIMFPVLSHA